MDKLVKVVSPAEGRVEREEVIDDPNAAELGRWFWVEVKDGWGEKAQVVKRLACVTYIGSNYAEMSFPSEYSSSIRVHLNDFLDETERELNPEAVIKSKIDQHQKKVRQLMGEVQRVTAQLGVGQRMTLGDGGAETTALVRATGTGDVKAYSTALEKAKNETLPELFKQIKEENKQCAIWMKAELLSYEGQIGDLNAITAVIKKRIFGVELYAGLCESIEQIQEGAPAADLEKIHIFQREAYMDEECLLDYDAGGLDFEKIRDFDKWLLRPHNLARLLPYPRCVVAFKVRRNEKHREVTTIAEYIRFLRDRDADKLTFLYIRNGEQVFCLETKIEFPEKLFPDPDQRDLLTTGQVYIRKDGKHLLSQASYEQRLKEDAEAAAQHARDWEAYKAADNAYDEAVAARDKEIVDTVGELTETSVLGYKSWRHLSADEMNKKQAIEEKHEPTIKALKDAIPRYPHHQDMETTKREYIEFTPDHIEYDDVCEKLQEAMDDHNRIVLVLQGLLDRSPVFHPHPPWQLGTPEGFVNALVPVYDFGRALHAGAKPDFEAFRKRMNLALKRGCYATGQMAVWEEQEAEKYNEKNYDTLGRERRRYRPRGNPGPGAVAKVVNIKDGMATFVWQKPRERVERDWKGRELPGQSETVETRMTCPVDRLMAVDFYKKGDYKQFFDDPRTREEYLEWAPFLLSAEDFKGKVK